MEGGAGIRRVKATLAPGMAGAVGSYISLILLAFSVALPPLLATAATYNVPKTPSAADRAAIALILARSGHADLLDRPIRSYEEEIAAIRAVQDAVLQVAPLNEGIPLDETREPADLLLWRQGLCYDRSRTIEMALELLRIETRHVTVYATDAAGSALRALIQPGIESHAVTEARTRRGWIAIDPNQRWLSLDATGAPVAVAQIAAHVAGAGRWSPDSAAAPHAIFTKPFTYVYGLYSRHGRFYPPMDSLPDVNWLDALDNLVDD